jgi:hypothetical protein
MVEREPEREPTEIKEPSFDIESKQSSTGTEVGD